MLLGRGGKIIKRVGMGDSCQEERRRGREVDKERRLYGLIQ